MYQIPIIAAFLLFPVLAGLFLIPFAYRMYHRYGHIPLWRTFVFYSFVYYILALIFYIVLPLPVVTPNFCTIYHTATIPQLHPFQFLNDIARETSGLALHDVLTSRAFWQAFLNVLLFVPLGVYLRYYYRWRFPLTIGIAFATSLFLELTQYTGLWHLYPCAYRLFDVDDIMLNTTGAVLGYGLAFCTRFLPSLQPGRIVSPHPVSLFRRLFAWVIDAIVIFICPLVIYAIIVSLLISYNRLTLLNTLIITYGSTFFCTCIFVFAFLDFVFFPLAFHGKTVGKQVVAMRLVSLDGTVPRGKQILVRYSVLVFPVTALNLLEALFSLNGWFQPSSSTLSWLLVFLYTAPIFFRSDRQSLGGLVSHTRNAVERRQKEELRVKSLPRM